MLQTPLSVSPPLLCPFRASQNWSPTPEAELQQNPEPQLSICSTNAYKAPVAGRALADDSWPGLLRTNLFVERSSMNATLDSAELASSCLRAQLFPLLPLPGSLSSCPFERNDFFLLFRLPYSVCTSLRSPVPHCPWDFYLLLSHDQKNTWRHIVRVGCYWHLVGRGQGCYQTCPSAWSRPHKG